MITYISWNIFGELKMSSPHEVEQYVLRFVEKKSQVLDIGVGFGKNGYIIRVFNQPKLLVGSDIFPPYLKICKFHRVYDDVVLHDASILPYKNKAFDVVLASEVIEHLDERAGINLLNEVERVARERIIVITPNKAEIRGGALTPAGFNPWEAHKSAWTVGDFKKRGYKIFSIGFGSYRHFGKLAYILDWLFTPFAALFPSIAKELIAVKDTWKRTE